MHPRPDTRHDDLLSYATATLINMASRTDRLAASLNELGWIANRPISMGVDVQLIRPRHFDEAAGFINPAYRSCLDAHLRAARYGLERDAEVLLVLEDDIEVDRRWRVAGAGILADLDRFDWDIANLGYLGPIPTEGPAQPPMPGWARFTGEVIGAHAYLLRRHVLETWIEHLEAIAEGEPGDELQGPMGPDGALNTITWVNPLITRYLHAPSMFGQRSSRSDINTRALDQVPLVGWGLSRVRAGKQLARRK